MTHFQPTNGTGVCFAKLDLQLISEDMKAKLAKCVTHHDTRAWGGEQAGITHSYHSAISTEFTWKDLWAPETPDPHMNDEDVPDGEDLEIGLDMGRMTQEKELLIALGIQKQLELKENAIEDAYHGRSMPAENARDYLASVLVDTVRAVAKVHLGIQSSHGNAPSQKKLKERMDMWDAQYAILGRARTLGTTSLQAALLEPEYVQARAFLYERKIHMPETVQDAHKWLDHRDTNRAEVSVRGLNGKSDALSEKNIRELSQSLFKPFGSSQASRLDSIITPGKVATSTGDMTKEYEAYRKTLAGTAEDMEMTPVTPEEKIRIR